MDAYSEYENEFESVYGSENESEIEFLLSQLHVLVVGCGGLGNEILKNLVSFNVKRIDIMDPDVIEISNLHRQIFFRDKDIGRKKVDVIKEIIERKYKDVVITGHVNKVQNFGSLFFEQFDIILGCLDNIEGRAYINNIIFNLKKNVIYIDGGAEGFNGSIKIINRNSDNACLNCTLYNYTNRNIPICSIVNKPKTAKECILYVINHLSSESGNKKIEKNKDGREKEKEKKKKKKNEEEEEEKKEKEKEEEIKKFKTELSEVKKEMRKIGKEIIKVEEEVIKLGEILEKKIIKGEDLDELEKLEIELEEKEKEEEEEEEEEEKKEKEKEKEEEEEKKNVKRVYKEAKKIAKKHGIDDVTFQLTKEVMANHAPTLCSTLMIVTSLMMREIFLLVDDKTEYVETIINRDVNTNKLNKRNSNNVLERNISIGDRYSDIMYVGDYGYYLYYYKMKKRPDCLICNKSYLYVCLKKSDKFISLVNLLLKKYNAKKCTVSSSSSIIYISSDFLKNAYEHKLHLNFQELIEKGEIQDGSGLNVITENSNVVVFINFE